MPLKKNASPEAFKSNIKAEMKAGKPQKQALAIAYSTKRAAMSKKPKNMAKGGYAYIQEDKGKDHPSDSGTLGSRGCPDCMAAGGMCMAHGGSVESYENEAPEKPQSKMAMYAEGGAVDAMKPLHTGPSMSKEDEDNEELHPERSASPMPLVDEGRDSEEQSDMEEDLPTVSKSLSLAAEIMKDRKMQRMAKGGSVKSYEEGSESSMVGADGGPIDNEMGMNETNDSDEMNSQKEDGRWQRGLNAEPVHYMEDDEHDTSEASLVAEIIKDRKNKRRGM